MNIISSLLAKRHDPRMKRYMQTPFELLERKRVASAAPLPAKEQQTLQTLQKDGYSEANSLVDPALLNELSIAGDKLFDEKKDAPRTAHKVFWSPLLPRETDAESIFVRFALQENILKLVGAYFKESPYLFDVSVLASYSSGSDVWQQSQLWHQDVEDAKTIKLWVYLNDVTTDAQGPFTYLPIEASKKIEGKGRISDEQIASLGLDKEAIVIKGEKKTSFLIDTRYCFHLGSRVLDDQVRVAYVATYFSYACQHPDNAFTGRRASSSKLVDLALNRPRK